MTTVHRVPQGALHVLRYVATLRQHLFREHGLVPGDVVLHLTSSQADQAALEAGLDPDDPRVASIGRIHGMRFEVHDEPFRTSDERYADDVG